MARRFAPVLLLALGIAPALAPTADAAFPGANGDIAFEQFDGNDTEIFSVAPGGGTPVQLTSNSVNDGSPAYSPDGKRIVFARGDFQLGFEIWVMNADGSGQTQLTSAAAGADDSVPAFSAGGGSVFFARSTGPPQFENRIWVMNADGSGQTELTSGSFDDAPTAAPAGGLIAFVRQVPSPGAEVGVVHTLPVGGGTPTALSPADGTVDASSPNYSPDGAQLAFSRCVKAPTDEACPDSPEIVRMPAGGGAISEVTSNSGQFDDPADLAPAFSPDGARIAFFRDDIFGTGLSDVFTVASAGGSGAALTSSGEASDPDWQPLAVPAPVRFRCFGEDVTITGGPGDDRIVGTPGDDVIRGFRGRDRITGKGGDDILCGGRGKDRLYGKKGDDVLIGGAQSDFLNGGPGKNRLFGGTPGAKPEKANNVCVVGPDDSERNCQTVK